MLYYSFLTIVIGLLVSGEIYFLGKYLSRTSDIYKYNEAASIVVGALFYFVITFFTFFVFIWLEPSILYYVVIFFVKEVFQILFLILRRDVFKGMKINWRSFGFSALAMISIPLAFNYFFVDQLSLTEPEQINDFQTWNLYKNVVSEFTKMDLTFVKKWLMSSVASLVIYNIVTSFIISVSKRKSLVEYSVGLLSTFILLLLFNFGQTLDSLIGIFLLLFAIQLSVDIIIKSRRRFAILIGLLDISIWFLQPSLFFAMLILSIAVALIYTYLKRNKASLFWVQLISPILLISSLWLYTDSSWGALILVIIAIFTYIFMIGIGRLDSLDRFDNKLKKVRFILPGVLMLILIITSISVGVIEEYKIENVWLYDNSIWESYNNTYWNTIQQCIYYIGMTGAFAYLAWITHTKSDILNFKIVIVIAAIFLIFGYSPLLRVATMNTMLADQFKYLRVVTFMPLTLIGIISLRKKIKI